MVFHDIGNLTQCSIDARLILERHLRQIRRSGDWQNVADTQSLIRGIDPTASSRCRGFEIAQRRFPQGLSRALDDLVEISARNIQSLRINANLQLPVTQTPD